MPNIVNIIITYYYLNFKISFILESPMNRFIYEKMIILIMKASKDNVGVTKDLKEKESEESWKISYEQVKFFFCDINKN